VIFNPITSAQIGLLLLEWTHIESASLSTATVPTRVRTAQAQPVECVIEKLTVAQLIRIFPES
jgi:hypothetical protein